MRKNFWELPFTLVRLMVTIPLFLLTGIVLATVLKKRQYKLEESTNTQSNRLLTG